MGTDEPTDRHELYRSFKKKISRETATDVLLDRVDSWLISDTPDGSVIVIKGPRAQELADMVRAELQKPPGINWDATRRLNDPR